LYAHFLQAHSKRFNLLLQARYCRFLFLVLAMLGQLKLMPWWDPLRGDPCFEQIVASLAPKGN
jgi:hypothetical protein